MATQNQGSAALNHPVPQNYDECVVLLEELKDLNEDLRKENSNMREENRRRSEQSVQVLDRIERRLAETAESEARRPPVRRGRPRQKPQNLPIPSTCRVSSFRPSR